MIGLALAAITYVRTYIVSRHRLGLEIAALRQQLVVCKRKRPRPYCATSTFDDPQLSRTVPDTDCRVIL